MLWLDHVLRVVPDFEASERRLRVEHGLEATCEVEFISMPEGGRPGLHATVLGTTGGEIRIV